MKELYNPQPTRLLIPTADELSPLLRHFVPYPLPEGSPRRAELRGLEGCRIPSDELTTLAVVQDALTQATTAEEAAELGTFFATIAYGGAKYLLADHTASNGMQPSRPTADTKPKPPRLRQNRYGAVPMLATPNPQNRPNTEQLRDRAIIASEACTHTFLARFASSEQQGIMTKKQQARQRAIDIFAGRLLLDTASQLAVIGTGDITSDPGNYIGDNETQLFGRDACATAMGIGNDLSLETGVHTSFVQGASWLSPASVELQRYGSPRVVKLFVTALSNRFDQTVKTFSTKNGLPVS